jgi:hypothetical protein
MAPKKAAAAKMVAQTSAVEMAPKVAVAGTKRAAEAAPAEEPASKRLAAVLKKHAVSQSLYKHIVEIFDHPLAVHLSQDSREMLLAALPHSLCVPSDLRQEFQEAIVKMMGQLMSQILSTMQTSLDAENEKVAGAETKKAELEEEIQTAEAALNQAQATTAAQQAELNRACSVTQAAVAEMTEAKDAQRAGDAAQALAQTDKQALEAAMLGDLAKLKSGDVGDAAPDTLYLNLEPLMLKLDLDASLRSATKPALLNTPEGRGLFDNKVVEELENSFTAKIEELGNAIANGQPATNARMAVVAEAEHKVTQAEAVQNAAADILASARTAQKEAQASLKTAKASLTEYMPEYKKATGARDQQQQQVQTFMDVNLASFDMLNTKISAKKKKALAASAAEAEAAAKAASVSEESAKACSAAKAAMAQAADVEEAAATEEHEATTTPTAEDASRAGGEAASANAAAAATAEMSIEEVPKIAEVPVALGTAAELGA